MNRYLLAMVGATVLGVATVVCAGPVERDGTVTHSTASLRGTYVHSGPVLINPVLPGTGARTSIQCYSVGTMTFDGAGTVRRSVEIACPYTEALAALGVPAPPAGVPTADELAVMGSSFTTQGTYEIGADGHGTISDKGLFRLGAATDLPMSSRLQLTVGRLGVPGVVRDIHVLVKNQSTQFPGAPMLMNSDVGAAFVATRR